MDAADEDIAERRAIRGLLQNWTGRRDAGDWKRFRTVWHPDGRMMAIWTQGTGDEHSVKPDMPGLKGPEMDALRARGAAWLAGSAVP